MPVFLPPLRERLDDMQGLAQQFIKKFAKQHGRSITDISNDCLDIFKAYRWPGNIRELENVIERAFIVENTDKITLGSLPEHLQHNRPAVTTTGPAGGLKTSTSYSGPLDFDIFKEEMEKDFIVNALKANRGRINQTVAQANIPKNTLLRKIRKYNINVKEITAAATGQKVEKPETN
jgi:transcriptional regulator with PAS, ATPase and Fis domain